MKAFVQTGLYHCWCPGCPHQASTAAPAQPAVLCIFKETGSVGKRPGPLQLLLMTQTLGPVVPLQEADALGAMEKLCRQLTYHLSPHSQWRRHRGLVKRKPQAW